MQKIFKVRAQTYWCQPPCPNHGTFGVCSPYRQSSIRFLPLFFISRLPPDSRLILYQLLFESSIILSPDFPGISLLFWLVIVLIFENKLNCIFCYCCPFPCLPLRFSYLRLSATDVLCTS